MSTAVQIYLLFPDGINVDTSLPQIPLFLAADGVHCVARIHYIDARPLAASDAMRFRIQGDLTMKFAIIGHPMAEVRETHSFHQSVLNSESSALVKRPVIGSTTSVDFHFEPRGTFDRHAHAEQTTYVPKIVLPSSCHIVTREKAELGNYVHRTELQVRYSISAELIRDKRVIVKTGAVIEIFDGMGLQPPTCVSDFSHEYTLTNSSVMRRGVLQKPGLLLGSSVEEPEPLIFSGDGNDTLCSDYA